MADTNFQFFISRDFHFYVLYMKSSDRTEMKGESVWYFGYFLIPKFTSYLPFQFEKSINIQIYLDSLRFFIYLYKKMYQFTYHFLFSYYIFFHYYCEHANLMFSFSFEFVIICKQMKSKIFNS